MTIRHHMGVFKRKAGGGARGGKRFDGGFAKKRSFDGPRGGFNKKGPRGGFGGSADRPQLFDAVCAECGVETQVPFRPNGRKPVLCRDCFRAEGGGASDERFGGRGAARPSYDKRRTFERKPDGNGNVDRRLSEIDAKLERIVAALEALTKNAS